jgi:hypothetical protein
MYSEHGNVEKEKDGRRENGLEVGREASQDNSRGGEVALSVLEAGSRKRKLESRERDE